MEGFFTSHDVWTESDNQILWDFIGEADLEQPNWPVFATARLPHKSPNQIMGHYMRHLMQLGSSGSGGPPPLPATGNSTTTPQQLVPQGESSHGLSGSGLLSSVVMPAPLSNPMAVPAAAPVLSDYGSSSFSTNSPSFPTFDPSSLLATSQDFSDLLPSSFPMTTPCLSAIYPSPKLAPSTVSTDLGSSSFSTPCPALPTSAPIQPLFTLAQTQALTTFAQTQALTTFAATPALPTLINSSSTLSMPPLALSDYMSSSRTPSPPAMETFDPSIFLADSPPLPTFDRSPFMAPPSPLFPTLDPLPSLSPSQAPPTFEPLPSLSPSQAPPTFDPSPLLEPSHAPPNFDHSPLLAPPLALPAFDPSPSMAPAPSVSTFNQMAPPVGVTSMRENSALVIEENPAYPESIIDLDMLELARLFNEEGISEPRPAMAQAAGQHEVLVPNGEEVTRSQSVMVQPPPMTDRTSGVMVERDKQAPPSPKAVRQVRQRKKNVQSSRKYRAPVAKGVSTRGLPWNEEEHRFFLLGLDVYGRGHWTKIARNFVLTRNPIQVASHAQKYFNRSAEPRQKRRPSILDIRSIDGPTVRQPRKPLSIYDIAKWNKSFRFPPINAYQTSLATVPQQPVNSGTVLERPQVIKASAPNVIHVKEAVGPSSSTDRKGKQPVVADEQPELSKNKKGKEIYDPYASKTSELWSF